MLTVMSVRLSLYLLLWGVQQAKQTKVGSTFAEKQEGHTAFRDRKTDKIILLQCFSSVNVWKWYPGGKLVLSRFGDVRV